MQEDIDFLETLASQAAVAIENSRLFEESTTDGLTGLYHQKFFKTRLRAEFERASRHDHIMVILLVDIDHFKKVNDVHGHLTGDNILKGVARIIHSSFRIEDVVARYGGEEFAVLLTEPNTEGARDAAERVRKRIESTSFEKGLKITVSVGMYIYNKESPCTSELELLQNADDALYRAKDKGRNQVSYFEEISKIRRVK
ncbi:MAG: diguanylate cyclase with sensor [Bacteriovoracaceae bacterium]|nr:diguanylate cyclase with sensor [Bacteriovoracaceae bacterium]